MARNRRGGTISHYCEIDVEDVLDDLDTDELVEELRSRRAIAPATSGQPWVRLRDAIDRGDLAAARDALAELERSHDDPEATAKMAARQAREIVEGRHPFLTLRDAAAIATGAVAKATN